MASDIRALVTGANGFIGSRLVQYLINKHVHVRALVRRKMFSRDSDYCQYVQGDVRDQDSLHDAIRGCDVVFHCAWGGRSLGEARMVNVQGTLNLLAAALSAGVGRIIHLSSVAVHGQDLPDILTEEYPIRFDGDTYSVTKAEGEQEALKFGRATGLEVVVLRPTLVYGPRSPLWLVSYFERVKNESLLLINSGRGLANLIYVDDLVEAVWMAAQRPGVAGRSFLVSGSEAVTWNDYVCCLSRMCGKPLPSSVPLWKARVIFWLSIPYCTLTERPKRISRLDLRLMSQNCTVSIDRARQELGFNPRFSLDEGMRNCEVWLRQKGYLPQMTSNS